jgi:glycosyltransferase involved in cell wall biosynthesis
MAFCKDTSAADIMRIGIWCAYGETLRPAEGIGVFTHALALGLAALPAVERVVLAVHAGDEPLVAETAVAGRGRIEVASLRRLPWLDRWRWKLLRRRHRRLSDAIASGGDGPLEARRAAVERAIGRVFARQRLEPSQLAATCDVWLLPHVAVERPFAAATVVVVHDMVPLHFPEMIKAGDRASFRRRSQRIVERSTLVGTMSRTIRDVDIVGLLGCPADKVRVVPPAVPDDLGIPVDSATLERLLPVTAGPFLLYPAAYRPYKNHARLVEALASLRRSGHPRLELVFTGFGPLPDELARLVAASGLDGAVHAVGSVDRSVLAGLYRAASATVVPSLYEQGSFPVMEALRCGCPVAVSDIPSLRESFAGLGDAVPFFDPSSPDAIAACVAELLADPERARARQRAAIAAAPLRSWDDAAAEWFDVLAEAVARHRAGG